MENKSTQEQIKEFAEWCGFTDIRIFGGRPGWDGTSPDGEFRAVEIDLNNLFRYAVPKLTSCNMVRHLNPYGYTFEFKCNIAERYCIVEDKDPALALYWAIWEVIHNGE